MSRLLAVTSVALALIGLATILATSSVVGSSTLVHAYRGAANVGAGVASAEQGRDYLSGLTEQDLRLMLSRRGVHSPEEATRGDLLLALRQLDEAEQRKAAETASFTRPVTVKVLYCVG
jgi:hypothetical protein